MKFCLIRCRTVFYKVSGWNDGSIKCDCFIRGSGVLWEEQVALNRNNQTIEFRAICPISGRAAVLRKDFCRFFFSGMYSYNFKLCLIGNKNYINNIGLRPNYIAVYKT